MLNLTLQPGNYVLFPFFIPCMIAVNKSLRMSVLFASFLMMVSAVMKCIIGKPTKLLTVSVYCSFSQSK